MYTIMTAYIVLSLFISVITAAMFEVIEQKQREKAAYDLAHAESADQKRQRVMNNVNDPEFIANLNAFFGMAVSDAAEFSRIPMVADVQRFARRIATCPAFESSVMCAIGGVAIVEVIETNKLAGGIGLYIVQQMFLVFFTCEVVVKLVAQGVNAKDYFRDSWNRFDFTIVMLSYLELLPFLSTGGAVTVLRLLRLLRVLRMLNSFPRLQGVSYYFFALTHLHHLSLLCLNPGYEISGHVVWTSQLGSAHDPPHQLYFRVDGDDDVWHK